ncbi:MAG: DNA primase regulatory subunit PriL [Candidatus Jordarchaeum sp.]|uniref:DNA primase regulatory subunit PriL n=1 Tax=Candidatus Jordarchaeum sp. TaxID=2823881 RepID=UPI00404A2FD7
MYSKADLAKYPFIVEAQKYIESLNLDIEDLASSEYSSVLKRGMERVLEALENGYVSYQGNAHVELLSFPIARLFVESLGDEYLRRRYAVAESKRADKLLANEEDDKLINIVKETFRWAVEKALKRVGGRFYEYKLKVNNYLEYAPYFQDKYWKLVNRVLDEGYVYVRKIDVARLISEAVKWRLMEKKGKPSELPPAMKEMINTIRIKLENQKIDRGIDEGISEVSKEAFPPCISKMLSVTLAGGNLSHHARFTLTSFLINVGISVDELIQIFSNVPDFDENMTRYQVEHIAGIIGGGTKYTPPACNTLKTYGICEKNEWCKNINHPLSYYRNILRNRQRGG